MRAHAWKPSPSSSRRRESATWVRDFTVPSGSPRCSAISLWLSPLKYASSSTCRCGGGSPASARADVRALLARDERCGDVLAARAIRDVVDVGAALRARLLAAHEVDGAPVHERQQVARGPRPRGVEARGAAPEVEERLLHDVLGLRRVAHDAQRERVGRPPEEVVELRERALVAVRAARDEQDVGRLGFHRRERTRAPALGWRATGGAGARGEGESAHARHSRHGGARFARLPRSRDGQLSESRQDSRRRRSARSKSGSRAIATMWRAPISW